MSNLLEAVKRFVEEAQTVHVGMPINDIVIEFKGLDTYRIVIVREQEWEDLMKEVKNEDSGSV